MSKFKVGDKVRVRKDLEVDNYYNGCRFSCHMVKFRDYVDTIVDIWPHCDGTPRYTLGHNSWTWTDDMLEPFEETHELKLEYNRNLNVYFLTDGVKTYCFGEYGATSKHPNDEYCKEIGQAIAYKRFMGVR